MNIQLKQYNNHKVFEASNSSGYSLLVGTSDNQCRKCDTTQWN